MQRWAEAARTGAAGKALTCHRKSIGKVAAKPYKDALEAAQRVYSGWKAEANQYAFLLSLLESMRMLRGASQRGTALGAREGVEPERRLTENPCAFSRTCCLQAVSQSLACIHLPSTSWTCNRPVKCWSPGRDSWKVDGAREEGKVEVVVEKDSRLPSTAKVGEASLGRWRREDLENLCAAQRAVKPWKAVL